MRCFLSDLSSRIAGLKVSGPDLHIGCSSVDMQQGVDLLVPLDDMQEKKISVTHAEALISPGQLFLPFLDLVRVALLLENPIPSRSLHPFLRKCCDAIQDPKIEVRSRNYQSAWFSPDKILDIRFQRVQIVASLQRSEQFWCDLAGVVGQRGAVFFVVLYLL
jgi:hypothetical protein